MVKERSERESRMSKRNRSERENRRMSMRIDLEVLNSFDLIIPRSISLMDSDDESMSVSVSRNGQRGAVFDFP